MSPNYTFDQSRFAELLLRKFFPEKTDIESALLRDYLIEHLSEYDRVDFSVRIGDGVPPPAGADANTARALVESTKRRVDMVGYFGQLATLVEAKSVVSHAVMGQLLMNREIWMRQFPDAPEPRLVAIGRRGAQQDIDVVVAHGISVYLYETANAH